jgi:hypothetical protein
MAEKIGCMGKAASALSSTERSKLLRRSEKKVLSHEWNTKEEALLG